MIKWEGDGQTIILQRAHGAVKLRFRVPRILNRFFSWIGEKEVQNREKEIRNREKGSPQIKKKLFEIQAKEYILNHNGSK